MSKKLMKLVAVIGLISASWTQCVWAGDVLKIIVPRRSAMTPVQRLNREGVDAVRKHQYESAATLFYKAYLYDPADPFTLNNLGYISELQGELDRAHKFYALAAEQGSTATIDRSSAKLLEGKPMNYTFDSLKNVPMRVNRMNLDAMDLLARNRGFQAVSLLHEALSVEPDNPFTLNNLAVAEEATGDYESALRDYDMVALSHSLEPVVVTRDRAWRGKPLSAMATASARRLQERTKKMDGAGLNATMFTMLGVSETNQNDWQRARKDFLHAYSLDPTSSFSLNNRGYVAEKDGDLETAEFFYEKARKASNSHARVGLATNTSAEGKQLTTVATDSDHKVNGEIDQYSEQRHQMTGPIELVPRNNTPGTDTSVPSERTSPPDITPAISESPVLHFPN
jgi:Flp pilus assembly protein TadD